jgi:predicted nucleic acid-binding protein
MWPGSWRSVSHSRVGLRQARFQALQSASEYCPRIFCQQVLAFMRYLASIAHLQDIHYLWRPFLRDPDDDMVLECAIASGSRFIVTHNVHDLRRVHEVGVEAITPAQFLQSIEVCP